MYKVYCDVCTCQIYNWHSGNHFRAAMTTELGEIELVILARKMVPKGEAAEHIHTCWGCLREILKDTVQEENHDRQKKDGNMDDLSAIRSPDNAI
jgi:hypothetical protein